MHDLFRNTGGLLISCIREKRRGSQALLQNGLFRLRCYSFISPGLHGLINAVLYNIEMGNIRIGTADIIHVLEEARTKWAGRSPQ